MGRFRRTSALMSLPAPGGLCIESTALSPRFRRLPGPETCNPGSGGDLAAGAIRAPVVRAGGLDRLTPLGRAGGSGRLAPLSGAESSLARSVGCEHEHARGGVGVQHASLSGNPALLRPIFQNDRRGRHLTGLELR